MQKALGLNRELLCSQFAMYKAQKIAVMRAIFGGDAKIGRKMNKDA